VTSVSVSASIQATDSTVAQKVNELLDQTPSLGKAEKIVVNDLKLLDQNGNPITNFTGKIKVKIPIPAGMSGNLKVLWYDPATNKVTDMNATQQDGFLVFETDHFSFYSVVQLATTSSSSTGSTSSSSSTSSANSSTNTKTGDSTSPILYAALLGSAMLSAIYLVISRKKRTSQK
jgi:LPXTG-motif cell wall-anchored protein